MMRIDTSGIAGWEDRVVVLEFEHDGHVYLWERRRTFVRLVEFRDVQVQPPADGLSDCTAWRPVPGGWKRELATAHAECSPADQFCRETGRRVALRRLAAVTGRATCTRLRKAAIQQYFQDRAARKREGATAA